MPENAINLTQYNPWEDTPLLGNEPLDLVEYDPWVDTPIVEPAQALDLGEYDPWQDTPIEDRYTTYNNLMGKDGYITQAADRGEISIGEEGDDRPGHFWKGVGVFASQAPSIATDVIPMTVYRAFRRGEDVTLEDETSIDRLIRKNIQERAKYKTLPEEERQKKWFRANIPFTNIGIDINLAQAEDVADSLGYSVVNAFATLLGRAVGRGVGATMGPAAPVATPSLGVAAGFASGYYVASGATRDEFVERARDAYLKEVGGVVNAETEAGWQARYEMIKSDADWTGFWEAAPETVGNLLMFGIAKLPIKGAIAKTGLPGAVNKLKNEAVRKIGTELINKVGIPAAKLMGMLTEETLTEALTTMKQSEIEYKNGMRDKPLSYLESIIEVLPTVLLTTPILGLGMGSAAKILEKTTGKIVEEKDKKKLTEIVDEMVAKIPREEVVVIREQAVKADPKHPIIDLIDKAVKTIPPPLPAVEKVSAPAKGVSPEAEVLEKGRLARKESVIKTLEAADQEAVWALGREHGLTDKEMDDRSIDQVIAMVADRITGITAPAVEGQGGGIDVLETVVSAIDKTFEPGTVKEAPTNATRAQGQKIASAMGTQVTFFEYSGTGKLAEINGFYDAESNRIFINSNAKNPVLRILGHEAWHQLKELHPDLYKNVLSVAKGSEKLFNEFIVDINKRRARVDLKALKPGNLTEEYFADFAGEMFAKASFWKAINESNPSFARKIAISLRKIIQDFRRIIAAKPELKKIKQPFENMDQVEKAMSEAFGEAFIREAAPAEAKERPAEKAKKEPKFSVQEDPVVMPPKLQTEFALAHEIYDSESLFDALEHMQALELRLRAYELAEPQDQFVKYFKEKTEEELDGLTDKIKERVEEAYDYWLERHDSGEGWTNQILDIDDEMGMYSNPSEAFDNGNVGVISSGSWSIDVEQEILDAVNKEYAIELEIPDNIEDMFAEIEDYDASLADEMRQEFKDEEIDEDDVRDRLTDFKYEDAAHHEEIMEVESGRALAEILDAQGWNSPIGQTIVDVMATKGFEAWRDNWGGSLEEAEDRIKEQRERLEQADTPGEKVVAINLALNENHVYGTMSEHLDVSESEMDDLASMGDDIEFSMLLRRNYKPRKDGSAKVMFDIKEKTLTTKETKFKKDEIVWAKEHPITKKPKKGIKLDIKTPEFKAVAVRANDGTIYKGKPGEIHIHVMERIPYSKKDGILYEDQGFIDQKGEFFTRSEASVMAGEFEAKMMRRKGLMDEPEKYEEHIQKFKETEFKDSDEIMSFIENKFHDKAGVAEGKKPKVSFSMKTLPEIEETENSKKMIAAAIKVMGITDNLLEAGYILPSGKLLDFSRKRVGGTPGMRSFDHRVIGRIDNPKMGGDETIKMNDGTDGMLQFMSETGAVRFRITDLYPGDSIVIVNVMNKLTDAQKRIISRAVKEFGGRIDIDIDDKWTKPIQYTSILWSQSFEGARPDEVIKFIESGEAKRKEPKLEIQAYHGTGTVFEEFDTGYIGTGEGAGALWGLYFSSIENIGKFYAEIAEKKASKTERQLYKVTIHKGKKPSEYKWLDLDEQVPGKIQKKAMGFISESPMTGKDLYDRMSVAKSKKEASLDLLEMGIDGIRYPTETLSGRLGKGFNYVVFDADAISIEDRISFSLKGPELSPIGKQYMDAFLGKQGEEAPIARSRIRGLLYPWKYVTGKSLATGETIGEVLIRKMQDKYIHLKKLQKRLSPTTQLEDKIDVYLSEEILSGRTTWQLDQFENNYVKPFLDKMLEIDIDVKDLDLYAYAAHAPERNDNIDKKNPDFREKGIPGSGMHTEIAKTIIKKYKEKGMLGKLEGLAKILYKINGARIKLLLNAGLITQDQHDAILGTYKRYVPLRGKEGEPDFMGSGRGFSTPSTGLQRALGRKSFAQSPLAWSLGAVEETIVKINKNEVGKSLLGLIREYPDKDLWTIDEVTTEQKWDPKKGEVETVRVPAWAQKDILHVWEDGKRRNVKIKDPLLEKALLNIGSEKMGAVVAALAKFNRYLAMVNTSLNPEFVLTNFIRDIQTAGINLTADQSSKLMRKVMKDVPKALRHAYRGYRGKPGIGDWGKWFTLYRSSGGSIGFFGLRGIDDKIKTIDSMIKRTKKGVLPAAQRGVSEIGGFISDVNSAVENAVRLASFKNAVESGLTPARAASLSKNLTVNFNRKGELGAFANAFYLFYNAGVQGTARVFQVMTSKTGRRIGAGIAGTAFMMTELNRMAGGDDEEDGRNYYDKIPNYVKERSIILMIPGTEGDYIRFPLPYGYNIFWVMGEQTNSALHSGKPVQGAINVLNAAVDAFNPMGGDSSLIRTLSPTLPDVLLDLYMNQNFAGYPIKPEQSQFGLPKPQSWLYWRSVSPISKYIAQKVNRLTGGNPIRPGKIDVSPEVLDYLVGTFTGAAGAFINRSLNLPIDLLTGKERAIHKTPFQRVLMGEQTEFYTGGEYRKVTEEIKRRIEEKEEGLPAVAPELSSELKSRYKATEKNLRSAGKRIKDIERSQLSAKRKKELVKEKRKQISLRQKDLIKRFDKEIGGNPWELVDVLNLRKARKKANE